MLTALLVFWIVFWSLERDRHFCWSPKHHRATNMIELGGWFALAACVFDIVVISILCAPWRVNP